MKLMVQNSETHRISFLNHKKKKKKKKIHSIFHIVYCILYIVYCILYIVINVIKFSYYFSLYLHRFHGTGVRLLRKKLFIEERRVITN